MGGVECKILKIICFLCGKIKKRLSYMMNLAEIMSIDPWPVSVGLVERIQSAMCTKSIKKGELLIKQGERCDYFFFIREGICRSFYANGDYEDTNLFASEGDIIGSPTCFYTDRPAYFSVEALSALEAYCLSFDSTRRLMDENRELTQWVAGLLFGQLAALETRFFYRGGPWEAETRYKEFIRWRKNKYLRYIPLKYIAQYLHMTPQTLSKIRRKMVKK